MDGFARGLVRKKTGEDDPMSWGPFGLAWKNGADIDQNDDR